MCLQVGRTNWFEGTKRPRRSGAIAVLADGRLRLVLPHGFLAKWRQAELAEATSEPSDLAKRTSPADLGQLLCAGNSSERLEAAEGLLSLGPKAHATVPALLVAMVVDELTAVRWRVVETLRKVGAPSYALPLLALTLRSDPSRSVRWRVAEALSAPSLPAKERAEALIQASGDQDHWVRWHAHRVLTQVVDETLLRPLLSRYAAESTETAVRVYALWLLESQERFEWKDLRQFTAGLWDDESEVRRCTLNLLVGQGIPEHDRQAHSGLRLCLQDLRPEVRESAVRALGGLARHHEASRALLEGTLWDPDPTVRTAALEELPHAKGSARERKQWLQVGLNDPVLSVRLKAALAFHKLEVADSTVVAALASTLWQEEPPIEGWRALLTLTNRYEDHVLSAISSLPVPVLGYLIAEDVAAGTLPTVGLRLWHARARIRFPNKEGGDMRSVGLGYPWVNAGVHHSWESHKPLLRSRLQGVVKQVSLAVQPFPYAHLIAAVEFSRYLPPALDGRTAPVYIEGRPVGSIIEGGNVSALLNPAGIGAGDYRGRLDFLYVIDLQLCQYAAFGATCERVSPKDQLPRQARASYAWRQFIDRLSHALAHSGSRDFIESEWFDPIGWESSRYGRRHERHYDDIREGTTRLFSILRSRNGQRLRRVIGEAVEEFCREIDSIIWSSHLRSYSQRLLGMFASGVAGERVALHASRVLQGDNSEK